jgi:preprotein translocase subunit SecA
VQPRIENGKPAPLSREDLEKAEKLVELDALQREVYQLWGVKLDVESRKKRSPLSIYDELSELTVQGLTEQRERFLDLIDRVVSAIVEESCPENKPPEDWDWNGIFQGFREHFKVSADKSLEELGDAEQIVARLYEQAEGIYRERESELGVDLALRIFRHIYLETIDEAWVEHLSNMEHLRDGIGLRGYGQRDPKNEYKKEGFNLFLNMMAKVSNTVLTKFAEVRIRRQEEIAALEAQDMERHQAELDQAVARHPGDGAPPAAGDALNQMREAAAAMPPPSRKTAPAAPKIGRNDLCPCGSGKKFKKCHGVALEDDDGGDNPQPQV